ncbi:MAG TPA: AraC family transcriptional regulator [Mycobacteriales bacterium]
MWRAGELDRVLLMAGRTTHYEVNPRGEYVFGVLADGLMRSRRGPERRIAHTGDVVAWDPSATHSGSAVDGRPWTSRLLVVEIADLAALADDPEGDPLADVAFPVPVFSDDELARDFLRLHTALELATTMLERDEHLSGWLRRLIDQRSATRRRSPVAARTDGGALRRALELLADQPERNISLDELAAAAGIGKFRLVRLLRERTGLPPHALQIAYRIRIARRMLEAGESVATTAHATGFVDQSHLHRHFHRTLGMTPLAYQRHFRHPAGSRGHSEG